MSFILGIVFLGASFLAGVVAHREGLIFEARAWVGEPNFYFLESLFHTSSLPTLTIDINIKSLEKIRAKREEALQRRLLFASDDDFVPAKIRFEGRTIPVKMRLKGKGVSHYITEKWSFRIHVKGEDHLFGMRRFSIQHPSTREYVNEFGYLENLRIEGVLAPRYQFVNVVLNGENKGIYALEEFVSKELLESQGRREGVLLVFDSELYWERQFQSPTGPSIRMRHLDTDFLTKPIKTYAAGRIDSSLTLTRERDEALSMLRGFQQGTLKASEVFDIPILARFLAISELWSAWHGLGEVKLYYNPVTAKLEPVGFDGQVFDNLDPVRAGRLISFDPLWSQFALHDPELARVYVAELTRISSPEYLEKLEGIIGQRFEDNTQELRREWRFLRQGPWETLALRQGFIRAILAPPTYVQAFILPTSHHVTKTSSASSTPATSIQVANLFVLPIEVLGFKLGSGPVIPAAGLLSSDASNGIESGGDASVVLNPRSSGSRRPSEFVDFAIDNHTLDLSLARGGDPSQPLYVVTRLLGRELAQQTPVVPYVSIAGVAAAPTAPTPEQALALHPYLELTGDPGMLRAIPGEWNVDSDLVLPEGVGLFIGPGTTLRFASDAVFLARGPLVFRGSAEQPVTLVPKDGSWPGIVVLDAKQLSSWEHVVVRHTHGIDRGGWILTGGITFYRSPVSLISTRIIGSSAEDAINTVLTTFDFDGVEITDTVSDAFDGDFSYGTITRLSVHDIVDDALDFSGSNVTLRDVMVRNVGDKGISAGEGSDINVIGYEAENVGIGVASKDRSSVTISDSSIHSFVHFALAVFVKKPEYGPASIAINKVFIPGGEESVLIQDGSWMKWNKTLLMGSKDIDVNLLYDTGVLGN